MIFCKDARLLERRKRPQWTEFLHKVQFYRKRIQMDIRFRSFFHDAAARQAKWHREILFSLLICYSQARSAVS